MNINELRDMVARLQSEIRELSELDDITPEQDTSLGGLLSEFDTRTAELSKMEERQAKIDAALARETKRVPAVAPQHMRRVDPTEVDVRRGSYGEVRDAALKVMETEGRHLSDAQATKVDALLRQRNGNVEGGDIAKLVLLTETDAYRSAFMKGITQQGPAWTPEEARAISEFRAASLTSASGGYGVPVFIDPTIILTSGAADAPLLSLARVETITTNAWKGVSSAGVSWSYDSEAAAVSDDAPTLAQPSVTTYMARGFIPFSFEIEMDYPGFQAEMSALLAQGYVDLVAAQSITGTNPQGLFTGLDAQTTSEVVVTTDGAFGAVDIDAIYAALPERFRSRATWVMNVDVENEIRGFGSGTATSRFTVDQSASGISRLNGKPVVTTDYAPTFTGTTGAANILVLADLRSCYLIAQRAGMSVELVPHLVDVTANRPTGQRGWFAYARHGMGVVNTSAGKLLQNT